MAYSSICKVIKYVSAVEHSVTKEEYQLTGVKIVDRTNMEDTEIFWSEAGQYRDAIWCIPC